MRGNASCSKISFDLDVCWDLNVRDKIEDKYYLHACKTKRATLTRMNGSVGDLPKAYPMFVSS